MQGIQADLNYYYRLIVRFSNTTGMFSSIRISDSNNSIELVQTEIQPQNNRWKFICSYAKLGGNNNSFSHIIKCVDSDNTVIYSDESSTFFPPNNRTYELYAIHL